MCVCVIVCVFVCVSLIAFWDAGDVGESRNDSESDRGRESETST
jgi:hypothetical protein